MVGFRGDDTVTVRFPPVQLHRIRGEADGIVVNTPKGDYNRLDPIPHLKL